MTLLLQASLLQACRLQGLLLTKAGAHGAVRLLPSIKGLAKAGMPLYSMAGGCSRVSAVKLAGEGRLASMQHSVM